MPFSEHNPWGYTGKTPVETQEIYAHKALHMGPLRKLRLSIFYFNTINIYSPELLYNFYMISVTLDFKIIIKFGISTSLEMLYKPKNQFEFNTTNIYIFCCATRITV